MPRDAIDRGGSTSPLRLEPEPTAPRPTHGSPCSDAAPGVVFRVVAGSPASAPGFDLAPGTYALGRSPDNDLIVDVSGVSRRHARVVVDEEGVLIEDLGSKNGTFVEGHRIDSSRVPAGSGVRFGSVTFRIEPVHPDDLVMGLFTGEDETLRAPIRDEPSTLHLDDGPGGGTGRSLAVLEELAHRMLAGGADGPRTALERLLEVLEAEGGCVLRWDGGGSPWVLAASGPVPEEWIIWEASRMIRASAAAAANTIRLDSVAGEDGQWVSLATATAGPGIRLGVGLFRPSGLTEGEWPLMASFLRLVRARMGGDDRQAPAAVPIPRLELPPGFVPGRSPAMLALYDELARLARSDIPVLLTGETGTGKEVLTQVLHASSGRRRAHLVAINCAALPAELLEAELFGIGAGVATGVAEREGRFVEADGGTLFLDEVGEMAPPLQAKLLRALEEGQVRPLGRRPRAVDVRIVAATNADLRQRARDGTFREDLFYRIAGCELRVPPLRERSLDVPALVEHFLRQEAEAQGKRVLGLSVRALELLCRHRWPGNVRELRNEVRRAVHLCPADRPIDSTLLSEHVRLSSTGEPSDLPMGTDDSLELAPRIERLERSLLIEALRRTGGNVSRSARLLGVSRNGLKAKLRRHGIPADRWKEG